MLCTIQYWTYNQGILLPLSLHCTPVANAVWKGLYIYIWVRVYESICFVFRNDKLVNHVIYMHDWAHWFLSLVFALYGLNYQSNNYIHVSAMWFFRFREILEIIIHSLMSPLLLWKFPTICVLNADGWNLPFIVTAPRLGKGWLISPHIKQWL